MLTPVLFCAKTLQVFRPARFSLLILSTPSKTSVIASLDNNDAEIKSHRYLSKVITLDSSLIVGENLIKLASIAKGETVRLESVLFHRATANLVSGSEKELNLIVEVLNDNPKVLR